MDKDNMEMLPANRSSVQYSLPNNRVRIQWEGNYLFL